MTENIASEIPNKSLLNINIELVLRVDAHTRDGLYRIKLPEPLFQIIGVNAELTEDQIRRIVKHGWFFVGAQEIAPVGELLIPKKFISYEFTRPQSYIPPVAPIEETHCD